MVSIRFEPESAGRQQRSGAIAASVAVINHGSVSVGLLVERHGRLSDACMLDVSSAFAVAINCC
jgi:hypothetical protein